LKILIFCNIIISMKRISIFFVILLFAGMTVFAQSQDMSFFTQELNRSGATIFEIRDVLQVVSEMNLTGIGDFYFGAINTYIRRLPDFPSSRERVAVEESAGYIIRGLAAEKHTAAAPQIWTLIQFFDIASPPNDGKIMSQAIVAMGEIGGRQYTQHITGFLDSYNTRTNINDQIRTQIQLVVTGCTKALEILSEPIGVKPVLVASTAWYDTDIRNIASNSLENLIESLREVIGDIVYGIMQDPMNSLEVKNKAYSVLLGSHAPNEAKAKVAAAALEASYSFFPTSQNQNMIRSMRENSINAIGRYGVAEDYVYPYMDRTYIEAYYTANTDLQTMIMVIRVLSEVKTLEGVDILVGKLREIHTRRQSGLWTENERILMRTITQAIAIAGLRHPEASSLLTLISMNSRYTAAEQSWARDALNVLNAIR